jgi:hypothetical protein
VRAGKNNQNGTKHQRYLCKPIPPDRPHRFVLPLPRVAVESDPQWRVADAVKNPHRGATASGRGQTFTTATVAEGLQQLALGVSYAKVGRWAATQRPERKQNEEGRRKRLATRNAARIAQGKPTIKRKPNEGANLWQVGADWVEMFSPVLWNSWQEELANEPPSHLPRVLVIDDVPFFGQPATEMTSRKEMVFSVLVATEYLPTSPTSKSYEHRVRLIRAYPTHTADAYELFVLDTGVVPDVVVSDSSKSIHAMLSHLRRANPNLIWVPSAFHIANQMNKLLAKIKWGRPATRFVPGQLAASINDYSFLSSKQEWVKWWAHFDERLTAQGIPPALYPTKWRRDYFDLIAAGLAYADKHTAIPRGTGAVEAAIRGTVKPFFESRAPFFTNIERTNRAADLLTLQMNKRMDKRRDIEKILREDAERNGGLIPPAKSITERKGERLLLDPNVIEASLAQMRKRAT